MTDAPARTRDVRMHGFRERAEVGTALAWIDAHAKPLPPEEIALEDAAGRTLAADVIAPLDVPGFDRAAMDGYALSGADTTGATEYNPLAFDVMGQALPGAPFAGARQAGACVRIMTGAPIPSWTDSVLPAEYATEEGGRIVVTRPVAPGQHVGRRGEDIRATSAALATGRRLRAQDLGLIASLGFARVAVVRRPRVRIVVTGDEIRPPGSKKGPYEIYDANSYMLSALAARDGAVLEPIVRLPDDRAAIGAALGAPGVDAILVSGGSSVGSEDHAPQLVAELGELALHGIAMRPSSPAGMGRIGPAFVFLVPGNPVSCLCAYDFFAGRALRLLGGRDGTFPHRTLVAPVARKIVSAIGRVDYCRVKLVEGQVEPLALSGASILSSTTRADGFVVVPAESEGYGPGTNVTVYRYE